MWGLQVFPVISPLVSSQEAVQTGQKCSATVAKGALTVVGWPPSPKPISSLSRPFNKTEHSHKQSCVMQQHTCTAQRLPSLPALACTASRNLLNTVLLHGGVQLGLT